MCIRDRDIGIGDEISLDTTDSQKYKITGIIQEKDTISSSPYPVSYTHLDVYKRQIHG